jgi:hypothetical protein
MAAPMKPPRPRGRAVVLAAALAVLTAAPILPPQVHREAEFAWTLRAVIREPAWAWGSEAAAAFDGARMYLPDGYPGLAAYDLADPSAPRLLFRLSSLELGGQAGAVAAKGSRVYVALPDRAQIAVLEIDASERPQIIQRIASPQWVEHMEIRGRLLFVHAGSFNDYPGGVYVYDLTWNPPKPAGLYPANLVDPGFAVTEDGVVLLARTPATDSAPTRLDIVDLSRPFRIAPLARWLSPYPGNIVDLDVREGSLYAASYWGGLWVLDASDPSRPRLRSRFDWDEPRFFTLGVRAWPPFVVLGTGGPEPGDRRFVVLKETAAGFETIAEVQAEAAIHSVARFGRLLILAEIESPWGNSNPQKILRIYEVLP